MKKRETGVVIGSPRRPPRSAAPDSGAQRARGLAPEPPALRQRFATAGCDVRKNVRHAWVT